MQPGSRIQSCSLIYNVMSERERERGATHHAHIRRRVFPKVLCWGELRKGKERDIGARGGQKACLMACIFGGRKMRRELSTKTCCYGGKLIASWFPNRQPNLFSISERRAPESCWWPLAYISHGCLMLMIILEHSHRESTRELFLYVPISADEIYSQHMQNNLFSTLYICSISA